MGFYSFLKFETMEILWVHIENILTDVNIYSLEATSITFHQGCGSKNKKKKIGFRTSSLVSKPDPKSLKHVGSHFPNLHKYKVKKCILHAQKVVILYTITYYLKWITTSWTHINKVRTAQISTFFLFIIAYYISRDKIKECSFIR